MTKIRKDIETFIAFLKEKLKHPAFEKAAGFVCSLLAVVLVGRLIFGISVNGCATIRAVKNHENIGEALSSDLFGDPRQETREITFTPPEKNFYPPVTRKHAYESLQSDRLKSAYRAIERSAFRVTDMPVSLTWMEDKYDSDVYLLARAHIPSLSMAEVYTVKQAVAADHPEIFWLAGACTIGENMRDGKYAILYSYYSYDEITERMARLEESLSSILNELDAGLSQYELEVRIHDILMRDVAYDDEAAERLDRFSDAATSYGALVNKSALCIGYSTAAKLLLERVGVESMTVTGKASDGGGQAHMWNLVRIEGQWYHLDVTWDAAYDYYHYFNLTDGMIGLNHETAPGYDKLTDQYLEDPGREMLFNFPLPVCNSTEYNYYEREAVKIADLKAGAALLNQAVMDAAASRKDVIYLLFDGGPGVDEIEEWTYRHVKNGLTDIHIVYGQDVSAKISYSKNAPWERLFRIRFEYN